MRKLVYTVVCCLLLSSCSYPVATVYRGLLQEDAPFTLFTIHIQRWSELRFSGLLALQRKQDGLSYALLDSSGITLIKAEIGDEGGHKLVQAKGEMNTSGLPEYLSTAFHRMFSVDPREYPCSQNGLNRLCLDTWEGAGWRKRETAGPFTVWQAEYGAAGSDELTEMIYEQPWGGVRITLKILNR